MSSSQSNNTWCSSVISPYAVHEKRLAQHTTGVEQKLTKHFILSRGELDLVRPAVSTSEPGIEHEIREKKEFGPIRRSASQQRFDPSSKHRKCERLYHVVVRAILQRLYLTVGIVARREHEHGEFGIGTTEPREHLEAVELRRHQVENYQIRRALMRER